MKSTLLFVILVFWTSRSFSQAVSINTDNSAPAATSILDVKSTDKGMLIPRMISSQRVAIGSGTPATGLLVYDLTSESFWFYNGTSWVELVGGYVSELRDADNDTKIQVEENPNEDIIRFDLGGEEKMVLQRNANNQTRLEFKNNNFNSFVGQHAGEFTSLASANTAFGYSALGSNSTGSDNTAIGYASLEFNTYGNQNTAIGEKALSHNTEGSYNIGIGPFALFTNTGNRRSTAIGFNAMTNADNNIGGIETFNTALGYESLRGSVIAANNTGIKNTAIGDRALFSNSSGNNNTALGVAALSSNTSGHSNTAIGDSSLLFNTNGNENTALGDRATVTAGATLNNATAIGAKAYVTQSNSLILGSINGVNGATNDVRVGIGITNPAYTLEVRGNLTRTGNFINTSTSQNYYGIYGSCNNTPNYGYGVYGYGGHAGVFGESDGSGPGFRNGVIGVGEGEEAQNTGVGGYAFGGPLALGVYGTASGATYNFAGFFALGDVYIQNNLGIGTEIPTAKLHVHHNSSQTTPQLLLYESASNNYSRLNFQNASGSSYWAIAGYNDVTNANERLNFYNSISGDIMSITGNGFVGIGTTIPTSKLQVVGIPVYADNAAAVAGGLTVGAFYRTATGVVMVVF